MSDAKLTHKALETRSVIQLYRGSVLDVSVDAIVNAANCSLMAGGGVDGAIHRAAGSELQEDCDSLNGCQTGHCKITKAYQITWAKYIIHAVGPRWNEKDAPALLWSCYEEALQTAARYDCHSIAFPCISTGIYGMPLEIAARQALDAIGFWMREHPNYEMHIFLCCYREEEYKVYSGMLQK